MAIVHIATKAISRKAGQSAVASAAYRAGVILDDKRYDKSHDYSKKSGVMSADIILPTALKAKGLIVSREEIWNKAEYVEQRTDSRVAREWLINLPYELDEGKRKALAHEFAQTLADKYNIIADCAIHSPSKKEVARGADPRNYHAHILVTTREAKIGAGGELFFDKQLKIPFEWSNKKRDEKGLQSSIKEIKDIRQLWVDMANKALVGLDVMELDARSFKAQGLDRLPTVKMGVDATNMERKGINTEKGNKNRAIHVINQRKEFTKQSNRKAADERHTVEYTEWATERVEWATNRNKHILKYVHSNLQRIERRQRDIKWAVREDERVIRLTNSNSKSDDSNSRNTEWALKRSEGILRLIGARESGAQTRKESIARFEQQAREVNKLIKDRANAIATAPSPFDDNARRARATRISEEQKRFDTAATSYDRRTRYYDRVIESAYRRARQIRLSYAKRLLDRHKADNRLRLGWNESLDDYPNKYDYRQSDLLDVFAKTFKLDKNNGEDHRDYMTRIANTFDSPFVKEHKATIDLLHDPKAERDQYDAIKTHYDTFIKNIDEQRKVIDDNTKRTLGNTGEVSRMTAESLSAPSYINALDIYINDETTAGQNKTLAIQYRADTINRTCQQFKHGMIGLRDIREADKRQTHSEALQASLNTFMSSYGKKLSNDQQKAINDGLSAAKQLVRSNTMSFRL